MHTNRDQSRQTRNVPSPLETALGQAAQGGASALGSQQPRGQEALALVCRPVGVVGLASGLLDLGVEEPGNSRWR
ncbi:hypothetical protein AB0J63_38750 [Streptosporangium canum]|uniref:hypothetical protein n=1 Tax=Streptosporangium canum TaxID=324952 RepID=UPI003420A53E